MIAVPSNALPKTAVEPKDTSWVALAYKSASEDLMQDPICIPVGGSHCIKAPACLTAELFAAVVGFCAGGVAGPNLCVACKGGLDQLFERLGKHLFAAWFPPV